MIYILIFILLLPFFLLLSLLLATFVIQIDSFQPVVRAGFIGIFQIYLFTESRLYIARVKILCFSFTFDMQRKKKKKKSEKKKSKAGKKKKKSLSPVNSFFLIRKYIRKVIRTFKIQELKLYFDSGNPAYNGILNGYFSMANIKRLILVINDNKKTGVQFKLENRFIRLVPIAICFFIDWIKLKRSVAKNNKK